MSDIAHYWNEDQIYSRTDEQARRERVWAWISDNYGPAVAHAWADAGYPDPPFRYTEIRLSGATTNTKETT